MAWLQLVEQGGSALKQVAASSVWARVSNDLRMSLSILGSQVHNLTDGGLTFQKTKKRFMSGYMSGFSLRLEKLERESSKYGTDDKHAAVLIELNKVDPEGMIRWFETQSAAHRSPAALAEYAKGSDKSGQVGSELLFKTLQRESLPIMAEASSSLANVGMATKDGVLATPNAPIHMITAKGGSSFGSTAKLFVHRTRDRPSSCDFGVTGDLDFLSHSSRGPNIFEGI